MRNTILPQLTIVSIKAKIMIRPNPFIVYCKKCNQSKVVHPKSDALSLKDVIQHCPKCGETMETKEVLTLLDKMKLFLYMN